MLEVNLMERLRLRELDSWKNSILKKKELKNKKYGWDSWTPNGINNWRWA
jgi:hypothetical protein